MADIIRTPRCFQCGGNFTTTSEWLRIKKIHVKGERDGERERVG